MKRGRLNRDLEDNAEPFAGDEDPLRDIPASGRLAIDWRPWLRALMVLGLVVLLMLGMLPRFLSLPPMRTMLLAKVNAALAPKSLSVDDWSLRWFGGMSFSGVHATDDALHADLQVVKVITSGGLFSMLPLGKVDLGTVTLDAPQLRIALPPPSAGESRPPEAHAQAKPAALPVSDLAVQLSIAGGRVEVQGTGTHPFLLEHLSLAANVQSVHNPVSLKLAAFVPWKDDAGVLSVEGSLPSLGYFISGGAPSQEHLKFGVRQLELQGFRALLESLSGQPWVGSGLADGTVDVSYRGWQAAQVKADLSVAHLSIEPPGKPVSPPGDVHVVTDLDYADGRIHVSQFACASPWVVMQADGQMDVQPDASNHRIGNLAAKADLDLPAITRDFGSLLRLRDDFHVTHGHLYVDGAFAGTPDAMAFKVGLVTSNLSLRVGAETLEWQPAPLATIDMILPYDQPPEVRDLQVCLPSIRMTGKGRMDRATVRTRIDLEGFTRDFRRIVSGCPQMSGLLEAELTTHPENGRVALALNATASGVQAEVMPGRKVQLNKGMLRCAGMVPVVDGRPVPDITDLQLTLETDAGSISGSAARIVCSASNQPPVLMDGQFKAEVDLAAARRMAGPFLTQLPSDAAIAGKLTSAISAGMQGGVAKIRINTVVQDLRLLTTAWDAREDDVRLRCSVDADASRDSIKLFDAHLASRVATLDVPEWQMQLPADGQPMQMQGTAKGELDLAALSGWQRAGKGGLPPQVEGKLTFQAQGATAREKVSINLSAVLDAFRLSTTNSVPFVEPHAELSLSGSLVDQASRMRLETLSLKSSLADLDAKGMIDDLANRRLAALSGNLAVNFDNVNKLLRARGIQYPVLSGHQSRAFSLNGPLDGACASFFSYGRANMALYLESVGAFGLTAGHADATAVLADGVLQLDYQPAMNQGKLVFNPSLEVTRTPMVLAFPARTHLLQNVQLTQEMLDQGLMLMLPLLHDCSVLGGSVDLTLQECHVPLGQTLTNDLTFTTAMTLRNLRLMPGGVLGSILGLTGHSGQEITIAQYDLTAECSRGRVKPSDLVLNVGGSRILLSGSVGLNGALAYTAVVPLSKELVGKELARYVEGETLHVPITGTISSPAIDRKAIDAEVKRIVRDAVRKGAAAALGGLLNDLRK